MFTTENTEGYTAEQIELLNAISGSIYPGDDPELRQAADQKAERELENGTHEEGGMIFRVIEMSDKDYNENKHQDQWEEWDWENDNS